jgi:hypothetical protein
MLTTPWPTPCWSFTWSLELLLSFLCIERTLTPVMISLPSLTTSSSSSWKVGNTFQKALTSTHVASTTDCPSHLTRTSCTTWAKRHLMTSTAVDRLCRDELEVALLAQLALHRDKAWASQHGMHYGAECQVAVPVCMQPCPLAPPCRMVHRTSGQACFCPELSEGTRGW